MRRSSIKNSFHVLVQVMESMRRQVEYLTLENERLQKELKEAHSNSDSALVTNLKVDEDGDGMERAAQLSTLTMDAQRPTSASSKIHRKAHETPGFPTRNAAPSVHAAPLLQLTPGTLPHATDKYSNDFDFSLKPQQQQPPIPPPHPIYNGELLQAPHPSGPQKQASIKNDFQSHSRAEIVSHASDLQSGRASAGRAAKIEPSFDAPSAASQASHLSVDSLASKPKTDLQPSAAAAAVPAIAVNMVNAAQVARPPSAGDRASDRSQNSERSTFSVSEANEG